MKRIDFASCKDAFEYREKHKGLSNFTIYGMTDYTYTYIYDNFKEGFDYNFSLINVVNLDIETDSKNGYGDPQKGDKEITSITLTKSKKSVTFGLFPYNGETEDRGYYYCKSEKELLLKFISVWRTREWLPDIVTGWNSEFYDIPYIVNRLKVVFGIEVANRLSPWGFITERKARWKNGKEFQTYDIGGVAHIDYMAAYKKFSMNEKESYKLDFIAEVELGEKKLDYSGYKNLNDLYERNFDLFIDYNIQDTHLIGKLEAKLHYIEQMVAIAYTQRVNFENTITTVKPWDILIHNFLMDQKIVVPPIEQNDADRLIEGGFVKQPKPGIYEWVASVDFTSLYPSLAMQYNISPDSFVEKLKDFPSREKIIAGDIKELTERLKKDDLCMAINGCLYKRDKRGFFPAILKKYFDGRKVFKKKMIEKEKEYEINPSKQVAYDKSKYDNLQNAYKLIGNSGYGAFLNKYFRWFDSNLGESITSGGQLTTQFICVKLNIFLNNLFKTKEQDYIIYCDTDSAYIDLSFVVKKIGLTDKKKIVKTLEKVINETIVPFINKVCHELAISLNAFETTTSVKLEVIADKVLFVAKKRYIINALYKEGVYFETAKPKVTGLETVRSNVPFVAKKALLESYKIILNGTQEDLFEHINKFKEEFYNLSFIEIANPSGVKGLDVYKGTQSLYKKGTPFHVRAALVFNQALEKFKLTTRYRPIVNFDKIKYCYLKKPNIFRENVIAVSDTMPEELDISNFIDYDRQFEKTFLKPLRNITNAIGWYVEKQWALEDVFG